MSPFPTILFHVGPFGITDAVVVSLAITVFLVLSVRIAMLFDRARLVLEIAYDALERSVTTTTTDDVRPLIPLVLTQWIFIGVANLVGLVPGIASPTRDLSLAAALAVVSLLAGHVHALRTRGISYLRQYIEPNPILLPFNVVGELSRTLALALRLFGNMLSASLIGAIMVAVAGLILPVPLMLLGVLTGLVQAYIFGILTLVFAASSAAVAAKPRRARTAGGPS